MSKRHCNLSKSQGVGELLSDLTEQLMKLLERQVAHVSETFQYVQDTLGMPQVARGEGELYIQEEKVFAHLPI